MDGKPVAVAHLTDPRCSDPGFVGADLAALARLREVLPVPATALVVSSPELWTSPRSAAPVLRNLRRLLTPFTGATTVRGWLLPSGETIGPVWHNIGTDAIEEAARELAGIALRRDRSARLVIAVQMFVPPDVSVRASVEPDAGTVRLRSCWGLDEDLGAPMWYDVLVLRGSGLQVEDHVVVHKPTATVPAGGGTRVAAIAPRLRGKPSLPVPRAVPIAQACVRMTDRLGTPAEFELALAGAQVWLLACRPG